MEEQNEDVIAAMNNISFKRLACNAVCLSENRETVEMDEEN
jgi:hypothetical protein